MKQNTLNWLSCSLLFLLLFSCKKKFDFLPLKTGKYQVEYLMIQSNGNTNLSKYIAYGPTKIGGGNYVFDIKLTDSTNICKASISNSQKKLTHFYWLTYYSVSDIAYRIDSYDCTEESLNIYYTSYSDTISGSITFKLLEE